MADKPDGKYELAVGKLACSEGLVGSEELELGSTLALEPVHSKELEPVQALEHNKALAQALGHSKVLELEPEHKLVPEPEQKLVLEPVHSKEQALALEHSKELVLELGKLDHKMVQEHRLVSCSN